MSLEKIFKSKDISFLKVEGTNELRLECPQCKSDKSDKKLYFNSESNRGYCHRCHWKGGLLALFKLFGLGNVAIPTPTLKDIKNAISRRQRNKVENITESALPTAAIFAWSHSRARRYLRTRGFNRKQVERYGFLYCPTGYFSKRLLLPVFDERGRYRTFAARYIGNSTSPSIRKYLYPKHFHVSRLLYGIYPRSSKKIKRFAILVEGIFDAIHCSSYGVCCFGTHLSDAQIDILRRARIKRVVIIFDHDRKRIARENIREAISKNKTKLRNVGIDAYSVWLPKKNTDPTDYPLSQLLQWCQKEINNG